MANTGFGTVYVEDPGDTTLYMRCSICSSDKRQVYVKLCTAKTQLGKPVLQIIAGLVGVGNSMTVSIYDAICYPCLHKYDVFDQFNHIANEMGADIVKTLAQNCASKITYATPTNQSQNNSSERQRENEGTAEVQAIEGTVGAQESEEEDDDTVEYILGM